MEEVRSTTEAVATCALCGLPIAGGSSTSGAFCCHACALVARIVGRGEPAGRAWDLLRLGIGALLAMNVMMLSLLLYAGSVEPATVRLVRCILLALATPALLILLPPIVKGGVGEVAQRRLNLDSLICLGSLAAFAVSAAHTARGRGEIYFDTATMLPLLVTVGKFLESTARKRAGALLHALDALLPERALRRGAGGWEDVPLGQVQGGDLVRVRPGERLPVDGVIEDGTTVIEEGAFTGEFLPRLRGLGDRVSAGTVNGGGVIEVRAERVSGDLLLQRIVALVEDAWSRPARSQRLAERAAALFIPCVILLSLASLVAWGFLGDPARGGVSALAVLVVACPCTMGIATPLATSLAVARAAREGVVVRGGDVMERLGEVATVFFDKTGTVTTGRPVLRNISVWDPAASIEELLGRLAPLEMASEHVLGKAVLEAARRRGVPLGSASAVTAHAGCGMTGSVTWRGETRRVKAGSLSFVRADNGGAYGDADGTTIEVAWDGEVRGRLTFHDPLRDSAPPCMEELRGEGVETALLSGDNSVAALEAAGLLGIERVAAPRTPEQKVEEVRERMTSGRTVALVGDGVNDAAALAAADAGIALGAGTDLARVSAHVVVLSDDLRLVPWLIRLSRRTRAIVRGNFAWSFGYNAVALAAAAAGLLHPLVAATAMVLSSLTVLGNSLRIAAFPGARRGHEC